MKPLTILFLGSLLLGQIGGMSLFPGVVIYVHDVILAILVVLYIKKVGRSKLIIPIAAFIAAAILSLLVNLWRFPLPEIGLGSLYLVRWVLYGALYVLVLQKYVAPKLWLKGLYAVGVGLGLIGLIQFFMYPDLRNLMYLGWDPHYYRVFSTLLDPNFLGIILVFTLLLGFGLSIKCRMWIILGQLIAFVALLLTYSRSSFLALGTAILVWACIRRNWKLLAVLAACTAIIFVFPKIPGDTLKLTRIDSTIARVGNWQESTELIAKAPVFGYGFNTLRYISPAVGDIVSKSAAGLDSSILFILATTGIVGLAAYGYLIFSILRINRTSIVCLSSFAALGVHSLFVNSAFYPWVMIWVWILTGAVTCDT
jgi:O-antigen ligase